MLNALKVELIMFRKYSNFLKNMHPIINCILGRCIDIVKGGLKDENKQQG